MPLQATASHAQRCPDATSNTASITRSTRMKTTKETTELVRAIGALAATLVVDLKDGKMSVIEMGGLLLHIGSMKEAISGITEVPSELADLDDSERASLLKIISDQLTGAGLSHRIADAAEKVLDLAYNAVRTILSIKNAPPSAVPA